MLGIERVPDAEFASEQPDGKAMVTTFPATKSVAAGHVRPKPVKVTDCPLVAMKLGFSEMLIEFEADKAPVADVVSATVHVELAFAEVEPGVNIALVGVEANAASVDTVAMTPPSARIPVNIVMTRFGERLGNSFPLFNAR